MDALTKLSATVFSPAKMVYIAYILLLWRSSTVAQPTAQHWEFPVCQFLWMSLGFLLAEIGHNDCARIWLNNLGERNRPEWLRPLVKDEEGKWFRAKD